MAIATLSLSVGPALTLTAGQTRVLSGAEMASMLPAELAANTRLYNVQSSKEDVLTVSFDRTTTSVTLTGVSAGTADIKVVMPAMQNLEVPEAVF